MRDAIEILVGGVVLAAAAAFLVYLNDAARGSAGGDGYELVASFSRAGSISAGSDVRIAGVRVGAVDGVGLNYESYQAEVRIRMRREARVPIDSTAQIRSDGIFGNAYIEIVPGAEDETLVHGDSFDFTSGAVDVIDLVGRAVTGGD